MKQIKYYLLSLVSGLLLAVTVVHAQESKPNSFESITVAQQGPVVNVKLMFSGPLTALPPGFSVAKPARIALDFANTINGLGKTSQSFNEGNLLSANIVQAEGLSLIHI